MKFVSLVVYNDVLTAMSDNGNTYYFCENDNHWKMWDNILSSAGGDE